MFKDNTLVPSKPASCRPFHNQQTKPLQPKKQAVRASLALFLPPRYATTDQLARRRSRSHGAGVMAALAPNSRSHLAPHLAPHLAHMVMAEKTGLCLQMGRAELGSGLELGLGLGSGSGFGFGFGFGLGFDQARRLAPLEEE